MVSIFLRFYASMLVALCILIVSMYAITVCVDRYRFEHFVEFSLLGSSKIVGEILARRSHEQQNEWLALLSDLSGSSLKIQNPIHLNLSGDELKSLSQTGLVLRLNVSETEATVIIAIEGRIDEYIVANMSNMNDHIGRALMLIVVTEIRSRRIVEENQSFKELQRQIGLPLSIVSLDDAGLSYAQSLFIEGNDFVVFTSDKLGLSASVTVYASLGQDSHAVLKLGEIERFIWRPVWFVVLLIVSSLVILALIAYIYILPVSRRLHSLQVQVASLGTDFSNRVSISGHDDLASLAMSVDEVVQRLFGLLTYQQEMTAVVLHEIRTPLARMKFQLAILETVEEQELLHKMPQSIIGLQQDILELEQLADEVLIHTSMKACEPEVVIIELDMKQLVQQAVRRTTNLNGHAAGLSFEVLDALTTPMIAADEHWIMRAVMNILTNAQRYAKHRVRLSLSEEAGMFLLKIEDDGQGVAASLKQGVFDAFSRQKPSRRQDSEGYGLGLAIVHQIMIWHNGSVIVEDSELGGASFIVSWPTRIATKH